MLLLHSRFLPGLLLLSYEPAGSVEADCTFAKPLTCQTFHANFSNTDLSSPVLPSTAPDLQMSIFKQEPLLQDSSPSAQYPLRLRVTAKVVPKKTKQQKEPGPPVVDKPQTPDERVENVIHYLRLVSVEKPESETKELKSFTALLLKDGRVFEDEESAPDVFDPTQRPPGSPGTGQWQRDGEAYALTFTDGTAGTAVSNAALTSPAPVSMILNGEFEVLSGRESEISAQRIIFFNDGSLILRKDEKTSKSGSYKIHLRSIEIDDGLGARQSLLFGVKEPTSNPSLLIIGNKLYQRIEKN